MSAVDAGATHVQRNVLVAKFHVGCAFAGQIFAAATSEDDCAVGASPFPLAVAFGCWLEKFESAGRLLLPVVMLVFKDRAAAFGSSGSSGSLQLVESPFVVGGLLGRLGFTAAARRVGAPSVAARAGWLLATGWCSMAPSWC